MSAPNATLRAAVALTRCGQFEDAVAAEPPVKHQYGTKSGAVPVVDRRCGGGPAYGTLRRLNGMVSSTG